MDSSDLVAIPEHLHISSVIPAIRRSVNEGLLGRKADLTVKIIDHHRDSGGVYGSPRITAELRAASERVSEKTVAKIMSEIGPAGISPRTFKVGTTIVDPTASFR